MTGFAAYPLDGQGHAGEVQKQTNMHVQSLQIGSDHREVDRLESLNGLELDHDFVLNQQIKTVLANATPLVPYQHRFLPIENNASLFEFDTQSLLIQCFQETRPKAAMHVYRRFDDL